MSSPIASGKKGPLESTLIMVHQKLSHSRRIDTLARCIADVIQARFQGAGEIRCLDVGCGDMQIAERVGVLAPNTKWSCIDIYDLPEDMKDSERWKKYRKFDGIHIPFEDRSMDIVLFCDVLHHVQTNAGALVAEAARVSPIVVVKDHFEYSVCSRMMLWAMDFLGNWGYGVSLPMRYFTQASFEELAQKAHLCSTRTDVGIDLYTHIPLVQTVLRPKWQFISVLTNDATRETGNRNAGPRT